MFSLHRLECINFYSRTFFSLFDILYIWFNYIYFMKWYFSVFGIQFGWKWSSHFKEAITNHE